MANRKPKQLPDIAPCPRPGCTRHREVRSEDTADGREENWVACMCGWEGPPESTPRGAIKTWNLRSDEEAERRGAMAVAAWMRSQGLINWSEVAIKAIERGEVLPKAQKPKPWIVSSPGVMGGKPCVRGTRITVETLQAAAKDWDEGQMLEAYPSITAVQLDAALAYRLPKMQKRGGRKA